MKTKPKQKPNKPYPSFPLTPHATGKWCKKVRGRLHYFGTWGDPEAAKAEYLAVAADIHEGREPGTSGTPKGGYILDKVVNAFIDDKWEAKERGAITEASYRKYPHALAKFVDILGKQRSVDGISPQTWGTLRKKLGKDISSLSLIREMTCIKACMAWAWENGYMKEPARYGSMFDKPSKAETRRERHQKDQEHGKPVLTPEDARRLLEASSGQLKAMILLGLNGGYGNEDCSVLRWDDIKGDTVDQARHKSGIPRCVTLWPETLAELAAVEKSDDLVFITRWGNQWHPTDAIGQEFDKLLVKVGLKEYEKRIVKVGDEEIEKDGKVIKGRGLGFYCLRRTFATIADECGDEHAKRRIMGQSFPGMNDSYVKRIAPARIKAVTDSVREVILGEGN